MLLLMKSLVPWAFDRDDFDCPRDCQKGLEALEDLPKPIKRTRPLTPAPSNKTQAQQQTGFFFTKLPIEIRRLILIKAFGERTLHMTLCDWNESEEDYTSRPKGFLHQVRHTLPVVGGCGPLQHRRQARPPKVGQKYQWQWYSSVCHRNPPNKSKGSMGARDGQLNAPWDDNCLKGEARYCAEWGRPGWDCGVGAMGFIKSCRQAYIEGLDVLYKTNTIHIANSTLFPRLPRLLLPERLADITSLEVVWEHHELRESLWGPSRPSHLPRYVHILSYHCTSLQKMFIAVVKSIQPRHTNIIEDFFMPFDVFLRCTPRLQEVCVSVPWDTFSDIIVAAIKPTPQAVLDKDEREKAHMRAVQLHPKVFDYVNPRPAVKFVPLHVWRPLSDECVAVEVDESPYPDAPAGFNKYREDGGLAGYWIVEGHERDGNRDVLIDDPT